MQKSMRFLQPLLICLFALQFGNSKEKLSNDFWSKFLLEQVHSNFERIKKEDSSLYFISGKLNDTLAIGFTVNKGGLIENHFKKNRFIDLELRLGSPKLDNTHPLRDLIENEGAEYRNLPVPMDTNRVLLSREFKLMTYQQFRSARERLQQIKSNLRVRPDEEDKGPDFTLHAPLYFSDSLYDSLNSARDFSGASVLSKTFLPDSLHWDSLRQEIQTISKRFANHNFIFASSISCGWVMAKSRYASTENRQINTLSRLGHLSVYVETKAEDGQVLWLQDNLFFREANPKIDLVKVEQMTKRLIETLLVLRVSPSMETYEGPVILENLAAAVFVHEVLGHRSEGHRQKVVDEGQTFADKVGKIVSNPTITIYDDPTLAKWGSVPLNGFYRFDDEGVAAEKAILIENGIFKGFLLGRSTLAAQVKSNGHGRALPGNWAVSRMGNTILSSRSSVSFAQLRSKLLNLLNQREKKFGVIVHDISGGFTYTGRELPQSYRVEPLLMTRIWADGRPDEWVRGVDLVGTPLNSLRQIVAVGNDQAVFNGFCGAESGWVPVSSISPSLLIESVEFETRARDQNRPPILAAPKVMP